MLCFIEEISWLIFRRTKVLWYKLSSLLAYVLHCPCCRCIVSLRQLGVCLFTTISKQGMDFHIQRDHYRKVYHLLLWLLLMGGACHRTPTHCLWRVSGCQVLPNVGILRGPHCTKLLGAQDCTRGHSAFQVHSPKIRRYGVQLCIKLPRFQQIGLPQAAQEVSPILTNWPMQPATCKCFKRFVVKNSRLFQFGGKVC